jgi:hypothetical protein
VTVAGGVNSQTTTVSAGQTPTSTATDTNLPPYRTLNYCIRLR